MSQQQATKRQPAAKLDDLLDREVVIGEVVYELGARLGESGMRYLGPAVRQIAAELPRMWRDAVDGKGHPLVVTIHEPALPGVAVTFELDAIPRALEMLCGDDAAIGASLARLRADVVAAGDTVYPLLAKMSDAADVRLGSTAAPRPIK